MAPGTLVTLCAPGFRHCQDERLEGDRRGGQRRAAPLRPGQLLRSEHGVGSLLKLAVAEGEGGQDEKVERGGRG